MRLLSTNLETKIIGFLGGMLLKLLYRTLRARVIGVDDTKIFWDEQAKIVYFWHEHQLALPWLYNGTRGVRVLNSFHRDGQRIAEGMKYHDIGSVGGSSSRGGARAALVLIHTLKAGINIGLTPDGPKGPRQVIKPGIVVIGKRSKAPIYPLGIGCSSAWRVKSWDRMLIPKPFSRVVVIVGSPILIPSDIDKNQEEEYRVLLTAKLEEVVEKAQELAGETVE